MGKKRERIKELERELEQASMDNRAYQREIVGKNAEIEVLRAATVTLTEKARQAEKQLQDGLDAKVAEILNIKTVEPQPEKVYPKCDKCDDWQVRGVWCIECGRPHCMKHDCKIGPC